MTSRYVGSRTGIHAARFVTIHFSTENAPLPWPYSLLLAAMSLDFYITVCVYSLPVPRQARVFLFQHLVVFLSVFINKQYLSFDASLGFPFSARSHYHVTLPLILYYFELPFISRKLWETLQSHLKFDFQPRLSACLHTTTSVPIRRLGLKEKQPYITWF